MNIELLFWGLCIRILGLVYIISFWDHFEFLSAWAGPRGIRPMKLKFEQTTKDFPGIKRFFYFPSVFWINSSDFAISLFSIAGVICGFFIMMGVGTWWALLVGWLLQVSLCIGVPSLAYFPFEVLLSEMTFLALFVPSINPIWQTEGFLEMSEFPLACVAFAWQLVTFKVMFGFGKIKFLHPGRKDWCFLQTHMVSQLSPTPTAYFAYNLLPLWVFQVAITIMFTVEIIVPPLVFVGIPSVTVAAAISYIALMGGIVLTGNYSFLNVLTVSLSFACIGDAWRAMWSSILPSMWAYPLVGLVCLVLYVGDILYLPWWTWCTTNWNHWPFFSVLKNNKLLEFYRWLGQLKIINAYGVFPPFSNPPAKLVSVFEGSMDGKTWGEYTYRELISREDQMPRFTAPTPHRYERLMDYSSRGQFDTDFQSSLLMDGPLEHARHNFIHIAARRLLEADSPVNNIFETTPFPASKPPKYVRVMTYLLSPRPLKDYWETGKLWKRSPVTTLVPALSLEDAHMEPQDLFPSIEFNHPDFRWWKKKSRLSEIMTPTGYEKVLNEPATEELWEFFKFVETRGPVSMKALPELLREIQQKYGKNKLLQLYPALGRLTAAMYHHLEPHYFFGKPPQIQVMSNFHLECLMQHVVSKGKDFYVSVIKDPSVLAPLVEKFNQSPEFAFYFMAMFRFEQTAFRCQTVRILRRFRLGNEVPKYGGPAAVQPGWIFFMFGMADFPLEPAPISLPEFIPPKSFLDTWIVNWEKDVDCK